MITVSYDQHCDDHDRDQTDDERDQVIGPPRCRQPDDHGRGHAGEHRPDHQPGRRLRPCSYHGQHQAGCGDHRQRDEVVDEELMLHDGGQAGQEQHQRRHRAVGEPRPSGSPGQQDGQRGRQHDRHRPDQQGAAEAEGCPPDRFGVRRLQGRQFGQPAQLPGPEPGRQTDPDRPGGRGHHRHRDRSAPVQQRDHDQTDQRDRQRHDLDRRGRCQQHAGADHRRQPGPVIIAAGQAGGDREHRQHHGQPVRLPERDRTLQAAGGTDCDRQRPGDQVRQVAGPEGAVQQQGDQAAEQQGLGLHRQLESTAALAQQPGRSEDGGHHQPVRQRAVGERLGDRQR
jgi:hypothetical protein